MYSLLFGGFHPCLGGMRCLQGSSLLLLGVKCYKPKALISQSKLSVCSLVWGFNVCKSILPSPACALRLPNQLLCSRVLGREQTQPSQCCLWGLNQTETCCSPKGLLSLGHSLCLCSHGPTCASLIFISITAFAACFKALSSAVPAVLCG